MACVIDGKQQRTYYQYDSIGQLTQRLTADDNYRYEYDAVGRVTAIHSLYSQQTFVYDSHDRIIKEQQNIGEIHRTYDDEAQTLTREIYLTGQAEQPITTLFHYNSLGELVKLSLPDNHCLDFEYDKNGNEIHRTSPQRFIFHQYYDEMDCLVSQRAGWEPQRFFDKEELRASGIPAPSFAEINSSYQYCINDAYKSAV